MHLLLSMIFVASFTLLSCGGSEPAEETEEVVEEVVVDEPAEEVVAATYACPMNCEGGESNEPGKCGACEMDLVQVEVEEEHSADDGHGHEEGEEVIEEGEGEE